MKQLGAALLVLIMGAAQAAEERLWPADVEADNIVHILRAAQTEEMNGKPVAMWILTDPNGMAFDEKTATKILERINAAEDGVQFRSREPEFQKMSDWYRTLEVQQ